MKRKLYIFTLRIGVMNIGDVAIGLTASLIGWFLFLFFILPYYLRRLRDQIVSDIPEMVKKAAPELQKSIKIDWIAILKDFETAMSDEKKVKEFMPALSTIAQVMVIQAETFMEQDEHFQKWLNGKVARWGEMIYKGAKNKAIKEAADYGINLEGASEGTEGLEMDDGIKKIIKMYTMFKQFKGGGF